MASSHRRRRSPLILSLLAASDVSLAFCPHLAASSSPPSKESQRRRAADGRRRGRSLYDSLSYYDAGACAANCFANDGGNLAAHHASPGGSSAMTTFDVMSYLSESEYGGSDVCVFSMQELRLPDGGMSAEHLAELIYLGDGAGRRMHELARSADSVLLSACTVGRMGAKEACSNARNGADGYDYFASDGDDDAAASGTTATRYEDRFCKSAVLRSPIDHPHAITIFRLNSNDAADAEAFLEEFREAHGTNMGWAQETGIGAGGHLLAKVVPCDDISERFRDPSRMYPDLADDNTVCDYVGRDGRHFAAEALREWQGLCSAWPRNEDGSAPRCHRAGVSASQAWMLSIAAAFVLGIVAKIAIHKSARPRELGVDKRELIAEVT